MPKTPLEEFKSLLVRAVRPEREAGPSGAEPAGEASPLVTARLGDFLSRFADPADREENLLRELWRVADESERRTLATLLVRLATGAEADEAPSRGPTH